MRYYSIMRPVMPGSYPKKAAAQEIENFDEKTFCEEIGREAWGYIDYSEELTESEAADYELVPAKENKEEITNKIDALFEELVPASGKADTVAGEIIRAVCRIGYRWFNDGDMVGVGYWKETCNPARDTLRRKPEAGLRGLYRICGEISSRMTFTRSDYRPLMWKSWRSLIYTRS